MPSVRDFNYIYRDVIFFERDFDYFILFLFL